MTTEKTQKNKIIDQILDALKDIFAPNLIALSGAGILQGLVILMQTTGIIQYDTAEDFILTRISSAVFYFLPVLLAYSSAKVFKTNQVLAASVALFLLHPDVVGVVGVYPPADFFGIPLSPGNYANSVIPIIIIIWAQSYIERFFIRVLPELIRGVFMPVFVLAFTGIVGYVILGPLGTLIGDGLGASIGFLNQYANWLVTTILGAFGLFIVMAGGHYSLFPVVTQQIVTNGFDSFMAPGLLPSNIALAGVALAVALKTRHNDYRNYSISSTITALLGVSQPALYGVALPIKRAMLGAIIGGGVGGLYAGLSGFVSYALINPGLAALPAFISPDGSLTNLFHALITSAISFAIGFMFVYTGSFEELPATDIEKITAE